MDVSLDDDEHPVTSWEGLAGNCGDGAKWQSWQGAKTTDTARMEGVDTNDEENFIGDEEAWMEDEEED